MLIAYSITVLTINTFSTKSREPHRLRTRFRAQHSYIIALYPFYYNVITQLLWAPIRILANELKHLKAKRFMQHFRKVGQYKQ